MSNTNDIVTKLDSLERQINLVQNNVNFSLGLSWAILGVVVAVIGVALYFLAKMWFNHRFEEESAKIDNKIKKFVVENPSILWAKGIGTLIWSKMLEDNNHESEIVIYVSSNISKDLILLSEFNCIVGKQKFAINDYEVSTKDNEIRVNFKHPNGMGMTMPQVEFFIVWQNPIYKV